MTNWTTRPQPVGHTQWRFPRPDEFRDGDLVALGGDLEPSTIINAYRRGIFPMKVTALQEVLAWWSPDPRGILPLDGLRVTRSMRQSAKRYEVRVDTCFEDVIRGCADPSREDGWIDSEFIAAYTELHELGWAHSVEVFDGDGQLAGGLYGVRIDGLFAGESMFHRGRDASKVALMALVDLMRTSGMSLLDVQWCKAHLASLGGINIPRQEYLEKLVDAVSVSGINNAIDRVIDRVGMPMNKSKETPDVNPVADDDVTTDEVVEEGEEAIAKYADGLETTDEAVEAIDETDRKLQKMRQRER